MALPGFSYIESRCPCPAFKWSEEDPMPERVIAGLLGLTGGVVGSLVAPWVQWAIEKRRKKVERRQDLVDRWREAIADYDGTGEEFASTPEYAAMRPHLDEEALDTMERGKIHIKKSRHSGSGKLWRKTMLDQVTQIEQEWDLV